MFKNLIFDFDGVICESVSIKTDAFYELYMPYGEDIAKKVMEHHIANGGMSRYEKFRHYHEHFLHKKIGRKEMDNLSEKFSRLVFEKIIKAPLVVGINDFFQHDAENFNCFIVSATPMDEIRKICEVKHLSEYFNGIFGSPTSKDIWVHHILEKHQLKKSETLFIGDALSDFNAARKNNIGFLLRRTDENFSLFQHKNIHAINDFTNFNDFLKNNRSESFML